VGQIRHTPNFVYGLGNETAAVGLGKLGIA
jgi:hypothetical protein